MQMTMIEFMLTAITGLIIGSIITGWSIKKKERITRQEQENTLKTLLKELESLKNEHQNLRQNMAISEEKLKELSACKEELEKLRQRNQSLSNETSRQQTQLEERKIALEEKKALIESLQKKTNELTDERLRLTSEMSKLQTSLKEQKQQHAEKLKLLEEAKSNLKNEFQTLAQEIFEKSSETFTEVNKQKLDALITPFREQIKDFAKKVDDTHLKETEQRSSLKEQIIQLQKLNQQISKEATNLTNALKGDTKTQGNWGEIILERVLNESGLRKGHEYEREKSFPSKDGGQLRPDVIVHLPEGKDVIIDSKVSLVAYERYCTAETNEARKQALKEHLTSIRNHLNGLSAKSYEHIKEIQSLDYVILFMPIEGAFRAAIEADENLLFEAGKKQVMLISPSTLLICLRTIHSLWQYEFQNQNARKIADRAAMLLEKFTNFVGDIESIGKALGTTQKAYDQAYSKLTGGPGNLVRQCEMLKDLGVKAKKSVSAKVLEDAQIDDDDPLKISEE